MGYEKLRAEPMRSSSSKSAAKNIVPGPTLKKAKNKRASICNCFFYIEVFQELCKHTQKHPLQIPANFILKIGIWHYWVTGEYDVTSGTLV
jgi:hypothetical protein